MSSKKYVVILGVVVGSIAIADESHDPPRLRARPIVEITPERRAELRALEAAAKPVERTIPEVALSTAFTVTARLDAIVDGRVQVSVPIPPDQVARLTGITEVQSASDISDNVLFQGRLYTSYPLLEQGAERGLIPVTGEDITFELRRGPQEIAFVVGWRKP